MISDVRPRESDGVPVDWANSCQCSGEGSEYRSEMALIGVDRGSVHVRVNRLRNV